MTDKVNINRLAVYGTLAPGRSNHNQISDLNGTWSKGTVCGKLVKEGFGYAQGYPALVLDPQAPQIEVQVFESIEFPHHWERLDGFEGPGYRRVLTEVQSESDTFLAWIYEAVI